MAIDQVKLNEMQANYKSAVDQWIAAIRQEEGLASVNHTEAEVDAWENAGYAEEDLKNKAKAAKKEYERALREEMFGF